MRRIDAHHHIWDLSVRSQDWMTGAEMEPVRRDFGLDDLAPLAGAAGIGRTILVQTVAVPDETGEFLTLAGMTDLVAGVVGWVDVAAPDAADALARNLDHPDAAKLVGIRDLAQYQDDPGWLASDQVIAGIRAVGSRGLTFDLLVLPHQLPAAVVAARTCHDQLFVLDHCAKPRIPTADIEPWATSIRELAQLPNVACKVSGLVTEAVWHGWTADDFRPFIDVLLTAFGPARLMFGSDWPVCLLSASYPEVVGLAAELMSQLSPAEAQDFWAGTAERFYQVSAI